MVGLLCDWRGSSSGYAEKLSEEKPPIGHTNGRKMAWSLQTDPALYIPIRWRGRWGWGRWMKRNTPEEQKDQYHLRYEMFPKLVWYSKQNIQHGVRHTLQDLLPSIFLLNTHWRNEYICMRRWKTLVQLQFVLQTKKPSPNPNFIDRTFSFKL